MKISKKFRIFLTAIFFVTIFVACDSVPDGTSYDYEEATTQIIEYSQTWASVAVTGDPSIMEELFADDFVGTDSDGRLYTKREFIEGVRSNPPNLQSNIVDEVNVRFYGNVAIAQGSETFTSNDGVTGRFIWTDIYVFKENKWEMVAAQDVTPPGNIDPDAVPFSSLGSSVANDQTINDASSDMSIEEHGVMTEAEQYNLERAEGFWRTLVMAGNVDQAEEYMTERYIQHNPNVSTGRDGFVDFFTTIMDPGPISDELEDPTAVKFAKGDYVVFVWERQNVDPATGETFDYNFFDVLRMQDGKVDEHWDSVYRNTPAPGEQVMPIIPGIGPRPVAPVNTVMEQAVQDLVDIEMKDILQYQNIDLALEVMAEDYIQNVPNVPEGRAGFMEFFNSFADPQPIQDAWLDEPELVITHGDIALYIMTRYSEDPARDNEVYKWNYFDMFRVEDGLIQEHWGSATLIDVPPSVEPPEGFVSFSN